MELEELRKHKAKHSVPEPSLTKEGKGSCMCNVSEDCNTSNIPNCQSDASYNEDLRTILPTQAPNLEIQNSNDQNKVPIPIELCLSKLWKRHLTKARNLLEALEKSDRFSIDKLSMVSVDDIPLHISIFNLLKECYQTRAKMSGKLQPFVNLIKDLKLESYVTNKYLLLSDDHNILNTPYWFYIG